jgi:hypothetical protein
LSWWIPDLRFVAGPLFFFGLIVIAAALLLFSLKTWRTPHHSAEEQARSEGVATQRANM